jgi:hypothetical protein
MRRAPALRIAPAAKSRDQKANRVPQARKRPIHQVATRRATARTGSARAFARGFAPAPLTSVPDSRVLARRPARIRLKPGVPRGFERAMHRAG